MEASERYPHDRVEMLPFIPPAAARIADIGCSGGGFGAALRAERGNQLDALWGLEPDPTSADLARGVYDHVITGLFPDQAGQFPLGTFDCVVFNDVLEHMPQPELALTAARDLLRPGGLLVASIPNVRHLSVSLGLLAKGRWQYEETGILDRTHLKFFTRRSATQMLEEAGWQVRQVKGIGAWYPTLRPIRTAFRGHLDEFLCVQFVYVAEVSHR